jgi:tetratricopeptide (TPR) repeat protein
MLRAFPEDAFFQVLLADCLLQQKLTSRALHLLDALQPLQDNRLTLEGELLLAEVYRNTQQPDKAKTLLQRMVLKHPDSDAAFVMLSKLLAQEALYAEASSLLQDFLDRHSDSHTVLTELGRINEQQGRPALAEQYFKRAITAAPDHAPAHNSLGVLYRNTQRYSLAKDCFEKALACDPAMIIAACNLADLYFTQGAYDQAEVHYNRALAADPACETAAAGKSVVLERTGRIKEALDLVLPYVSQDNCNIHTLLAFTRTSHIVNQEPEAIELLERAVEIQDLSAGECMQACFLLGKLLDRMGDYDRAFHYYEKGNELHPHPFDREAHSKLVKAVKKVFDADGMSSLPRSSNLTGRLIFIVGMPRSGTTLTEQILASHPQIYGAGELNDVCNFAIELQHLLGASQTFPLYMPAITQALLDTISFRHLQRLDSLSGGAVCIIDKLPANFMFLGLIELLFPGARILHCVRDPMDTCLSAYFQNFSRGQYFSYNQSDLGFYYRQYRDVMAHWKSVLSLPILEVDYQQLVRDQEAVSRDILSFLGLDWHPDCLNFHNSGRKIRTASYDQVRSPVYRTSLDRWKNYAPHLAELIRSLSQQPSVL